MFSLFSIRPLPHSTLFPYTTLFRSRARDRDPATCGLTSTRRQSHGDYPRNPVAGRSGAARSTGRPARCAWSERDRKSTRLNSSHLGISYAVFCLKKKKDKEQRTNHV